MPLEWRHMTTYNRGDIILVYYPYSDDPTKVKKRPGLVIQDNGISIHNNSYIIAQITTQLRDGATTQVVIKKNSKNWNKTGLLDTCAVSTDVLHTFHFSQIIKKLGYLADMLPVEQALKVSLGIK